MYFKSYPYTHGWQPAPWMLAAGVLHEWKVQPQEAFHQLASFHARHHDWLMGHVGYPMSSYLWPDISRKSCLSGFPDIYFFVPEILILVQDNQVHIGIHGSATEAQHIFYEICHSQIRHPAFQNSLRVFPSLTRTQYLDILHHILQHIRRGDCYEMNFCQLFTAHPTNMLPAETFLQLPPAPFSLCYRWHDAYLLCASPERYLLKRGSQVIMQPMKGTIARGRDQEEDAQQRFRLQNSPKERAENTIVVDLVRNDLSRTAIPGTVQVTEWMKIYSYPTVHQMVSTIRSEMDNAYQIGDLLATTFPMGSMTGAPKKKVLQLIDAYESWPRGIYSGATGYITPEGDMEMNVVIRSLLYTSPSGELFYHAGSGITCYSHPEAEWEECLLKTQQLSQIRI
ncbi:MAG: anthranilate synthase component I family protein [Thermoflavifilum sp.]|nr:anthranilate synthase component I family protein [Thermoflavifilum sp.]